MRAVFALALFGAISVLAGVDEEFTVLQTEAKKEKWEFKLEKTDAFRNSIRWGWSRMTGLVKPRNWEELGSFKSDFRVPELPEKFDLRDQFGKLPPIRNQGNCGSCWAFATTAALEIEAFLRNQGKDDINLSEQELVSCSGAGSCRGGFFDAHNYQRKPGQAVERDFPYTARNSFCKRGLDHPEKILNWHYLGERGRKPAVEEIKSALFSGHPVVVDVTANRAMSAYRGGQFKGTACSRSSTNHMVTLVGWDKNGWIMRNSWGSNWGEAGYMHITYGCSRIGEIASVVDID